MIAGIDVRGTVRRLLSEYAVSYSTSFLGFLIVISSARILGAEQFAWVAAGVAFGGFIIPLTSLGSDLTFVRDAVAAGDRRVIRQMAATTFGMRVAMSVGLSAALFAFAPLYAGSLGNGIATALLAVWAGMQGLYAMSWFDYLGKTRLQNVVVLVERVLSLLAIGCINLLPDYLHSAIVLGCALSVIRAASVVAQVAVWNAVYGGDRQSVRLAIPRRHPGLNLQVTAASVSNAILVYGNQLFLEGHRLELASYGLSFQIVGLILIFQNQTARLVSRKVAESCRQRSLILRSTVENVLLMAGVSTLLALVAFGIIASLPTLMSDPRYEATKQVAPLLCVWVIVAGAANAVIQHVLACREESFYLATSIVSGVVAAGLGAILVPRYGSIAVAAILVGVHFLMLAANFTRLVGVAHGDPVARPAVTGSET